VDFSGGASKLIEKTSAMKAAQVSPYISKEVSFRFRGIDFKFALSHGLFSSNDIDTGTRLLLRVLSQTWDRDIAEGHPLPHAVLDAGCGVGVIGICAARALMQLYVEAVDNTGSVDAGASGIDGDAERPPFFVRAQDRDELARLFTNYNAEKNLLQTAEGGIGPDCNNPVPVPPQSVPPAPPSIPTALEAYTEPLLAFPADCRWDLILTNIPAKAGAPVLDDFVCRSLAALNPGGRVIMVAVNTLSLFFRSLINRNGALVREETGKEHTVFVYQRKQPRSPVDAAGLPESAGADSDSGTEQDEPVTGATGGLPRRQCGPVIAGENFVRDNPFYLRSSGDYEMEGISYHIDAVHGAAEFDRPGGAAAAAAKLVCRLELEKIYPLPKKTYNEAEVRGAILIHESGQGHFPAWLLRYGARGTDGGAENGGGFFHPKLLVLSGRNILALKAARHNTKAALVTAETLVSIRAIPRTELQAPPELPAALPELSIEAYYLIVVFPETVPQSDRTGALWEGLAQLLLPGGTALVSLPSSEAEKFDRKKTAGFSRLGDIKRQGFRALAYRRNQY
jgi:hypothetical protein